MNYLFVVVNDNKLVTVMRTGNKTGAGFHISGSERGQNRSQDIQYMRNKLSFISEDDETLFKFLFLYGT